MGHLRVLTPYYADKVTDYLLVDPPTSGWLVKGGNVKKNVDVFSVRDLQEKNIEVGV